MSYDLLRFILDPVVCFRLLAPRCGGTFWWCGVGVPERGEARPSLSLRAEALWREPAPGASRHCPASVWGGAAVAMSLGAGGW